MDTTDSSLNRIEKRKLKFRDNITRAAIKLFEEQSIAETSVASIIKEADIAHKTFFNHFPTKEHLLRHISGTYSEKAYDKFRKGITRFDDPGKRVEFCLMSIAKTLENIKPHYKELLNFYMISGSGSGELQRQQKEGFTSIIETILVDAKAQNRLRTGSTIDTYAEVVAGVCAYTLLNWSLQEDYPIVEKMRKAVKFLNTSIFTEKA